MRIVNRGHTVHIEIPNCVSIFGGHYSRLLLRLIKSVYIPRCLAIFHSGCVCSGLVLRVFWYLYGRYQKRHLGHPCAERQDTRHFKY
jgi:hypothetical protein